MARIDSAGRDVTNLPGLWDESDTQTTENTMNKFHIPDGAELGSVPTFLDTMRKRMDQAREQCLQKVIAETGATGDKVRLFAVEKPSGPGGQYFMTYRGCVVAVMFFTARVKYTVTQTVDEVDRELAQIVNPITSAEGARNDAYELREALGSLAPSDSDIDSYRTLVSGLNRGTLDDAIARIDPHEFVTCTKCESREHSSQTYRCPKCDVHFCSTCHPRDQWILNGECDCNRVLINDWLGKRSVDKPSPVLGWRERMETVIAMAKIGHLRKSVKGCLDEYDAGNETHASARFLHVVDKFCVPNSPIHYMAHKGNRK